ncbi:MAG: glycosyltransferase [Bacteroidota bacterium]
MLHITLLIIFSLAIVFQISYLVLILAGFNKIGIKKPQEAYLPLSVIICARNELNNLKELIPSLLNQSHQSFEIVIVNDQSTDGTREYLDEQQQHFQSLKIIHIETTPDHINRKKYALTLGIKAAKNEDLVFTDADCLPASGNWLTNIQAGLKDHDIALGYSGYQKLPGLLNYFIRFETLWTGIQYIGFAGRGLPYMGVGRNLAYKKSLFLSAKGFNGYQGIVGGDDDLFVQKNATKQNTTVVVGSDSLTISRPKTSIKNFFIQKLRHLSVGKHYTFKSKIGLSVWSLSLLLSWVLFISLAILRIELYLVAGSFFLRTLIFYLTFNRSCLKLGERFELWGLIALDCIFVAYFTSVGIMALFIKRVKWT